VIINVDFNVTEQRLVKFSISSRYWRKKWEYNGSVDQLFIDFKKAYNSVRREEITQYSQWMWNTQKTSRAN
jgi:hypothetical protein